MPEDFFADGFGQQQGVIFTKQQDEFLEKKIVFLDPMKTYQISIGKVLALLKYTKVDNQAIKKILNNSCKNGQKIITYEQMKKIFRGVALKQSKIQPSKINIQANIKTKMPIFYDDDEDSEQQEQSKPQSPPVQKKEQQPQQRSSITPAQTHVTPVNQPPHPPKVQQPAQQMNPIKAYDEYWKTLKTKNNLIEGTVVKQMFSKNTVSKNNLSKAWKLCNISEKGLLTKGEFFIFMNLIHNANIPDSLTKEMKDLIHQIQQACGYKKSSSQPTNQRSSSMSVPQKKPRPSSDAFDKFGDESLFAKNSSKIQQAPKPVQKPSSSNVFSAPGSSNLSSSAVMTAVSNQQVAQTSNANNSALFLLQKVQKIAKREKVNDKQISTITANNEQLVAGLGSIEQYLSVVEKNMQSTVAQIEGLKQIQQSLNQRLNSVCLKFKTIISKQSECITYLMETIKVDSQSNSARLQILQSYTQQMIDTVEGKIQNVKHEVANVQRQQAQSYQKLKIKNEQLSQKLSSQPQISSITTFPLTRNSSEAIKKGKSYPTSPQAHYESRIDPFEDNQPEQSHTGHQHHINDSNLAAEQQRPSSKTNEGGMQHEQPSHHFQIEQRQSPQQQQGGIYLESLSPEERKKTKQMLLIQILNSVSSMNQEQYAQVVNKVVAMTEEQMNQSYTKLYALYMQNLAKSGVAPKYPVPTPEQFTAAH